MGAPDAGVSPADEREAPASSHFGSTAGEVDFASPAPDLDGSEFKLAQARSRAGIPLSLMKAPWAGKRSGGAQLDADRQQKGCRPPAYAGLSALARGMAGLTPLQDTLLVWERTGERQDLVLRAVASRVRGWDVELWQAEYLVRVSLLHARWPDYRGAYELTPLPNISERKFWRLLQEASGWIRAELHLAHLKLACVHSGRTLTDEPTLRGISHTGNEGSQSVHFPTRPNCRLRKSRRSSVPPAKPKAA